MPFDFMPPGHVKINEFLAKLRSYVFEKHINLSDCLKQSQAIHLKSDFPYEKTNYTLYEIDGSKEIYLKTLLNQDAQKTLSFPLMEINVEIIRSTENRPKDDRYNVTYKSITKTVSSFNEFSNLINFYLQDKKIKEALRKALCTKTLNHYAYHETKARNLIGKEWVDNDKWYRLITDGRLTVKHEDGWDSYEFMNQDIFLIDTTNVYSYGSLEAVKTPLVYNILMYGYSQENDKHEPKLEWIKSENHKTELLTMKEGSIIYDFDAQEFYPSPDAFNKTKDIGEEINQQKSQKTETTPPETAVKKEEAQKKRPLINLDLYKTPWLEVLNHTYDVHGEEGIKKLSKKVIENTINDYISDKDLPIDSKTDIEYLAKFIRMAEQKMGKAYYDQLKKQKDQNKNQRKDDISF